MILQDQKILEITKNELLTNSHDLQPFKKNISDSNLVWSLPRYNARLELDY